MRSSSGLVVGGMTTRRAIATVITAAMVPTAPASSPIAAAAMPIAPAAPVRRLIRALLAMPVVRVGSGAACRRHPLHPRL